MKPATLPPFRPFPFLGNPHLQTLISALFNLRSEPPSGTRYVRLPDGDQLALEVSTPDDWRPDRPTVVMIHGLCGCHASSYLCRMARKLFQRGARAVRVNMRGCGSGRGLARNPYHSGRSEDVLEVLRDLREENTATPITLIGFSLGGNIVLKLAGELSSGAADYLEKVIAVCPPANLESCSRMLSQPGNQLYDQKFVRLLRKSVRERETKFPDVLHIGLPSHLSLFGFDDVYTAPTNGYRGALDYYAKCSAAPLVPRIRIPCHILLAEDDPFVDPRALDGLELPDNVQVARTRRGGHLGFLGIPGTRGGYRWMDSQLLDWIFDGATG